MDDKAQPTAADVSRHAEKQQANNQPDPFPPEGTDEKVLATGIENPLSEEDRRKATEAVVHHKP